MPRLLVIGDIHGCLTAFRTLLDFAELQSDDVLLTLGDYVDRGPDSKGVIEQLIKLDASHRLIALRGNHEIMMLFARDNEADFQRWLGIGGDAVLASYGINAARGPKSLSEIPASHWLFLTSKLLAFYETETHFFVHANADPDVDLAEQKDSTLYWKRFDFPGRHQSEKVMVCGHSSQKSGLPIVTEHAMCIDTWACGTGWLSCLDVEAGIIYQANQYAETRRFMAHDFL